MVQLTLAEDDKIKKEEAKDEKKREELPSFAQSTKGFIFEIVKIVVIALAIIIPIRYFLFQPFYVRGASMEPTFHDSEYLIIDEITYRFSDPQRGDVVVLRDPRNKAEFIIKRIIGLPGETVVVNNEHVSIMNSRYPSGIELTEAYLPDGVVTGGNEEVTLKPTEYFVLGDNRSVSLDSRIFGPLTKDYIIGRAWLRVWPFNEFQHFTVPQYNLLAK